MVTFLIIILILYILWRIFKPTIIRYAQDRIIRHVTEQQRRAFEEQQRQGGFGGGNPFFNGFYGFYGFGNGEGGGDDARPDRRQRRRSFMRSVGEYVEFEEMKGEFHSTETSGGARGTITESQVTDAEWEEIR